jgi:hypothetical protein
VDFISIEGSWWSVVGLIVLLGIFGAIGYLLLVLPRSSKSRKDDRSKDEKDNAP